MRVLTVGLLSMSLCGIGCDRGTAASRTDANATPTATGGVATSATTKPADTNPATTAEAPAVREVTIPAGTELPIALDSSVGSDTSRPEQPVQAHLTRPVVVRGVTVLPAGSRITGVVTDATRSGKVKGRAHVAMRFDSLTPAQSDARYRISTTAVGRTAPATKKKDALEIGGGAAGGALVGAIVGGKKGAAIGSVAGGGAGTAVVLSTRGKEVRLGRGAAMTIRLIEPVTVRVAR